MQQAVVWTSSSSESSYTRCMHLSSLCSKGGRRGTSSSWEGWGRHLSNDILNHFHKGWCFVSWKCYRRYTSHSNSRVIRSFKIFLVGTLVRLVPLSSLSAVPTFVCQAVPQNVSDKSADMTLVGGVVCSWFVWQMPLKVVVEIGLFGWVAPIDNSFEPYRVMLEIGVGGEPLSFRWPIGIEDSHRFIWSSQSWCHSR